MEGRLFAARSPLIFGFNTDVKHGDAVYHVQSEARVHDHLLQTQVFVKGRCIGKRATSYADQVSHPNFSDAHMQELLKEQHRFMVNAARGGTIEHELENPSPISFPQLVAAQPAAAAAAPAPAADDTPGLAMDTAPPGADSDVGVLEIPQVVIGPVDAATDVLDSAGLSDLMAAIDANTPKAIVEPVGNPIGSGLELQCVNPETAYDGSFAVIKVLVTQEGTPVPDAQVTCRATVGTAQPARAYSNTQADGTAEIRVEVHATEMDTATILIQASFRGKNLSRRFHLVKPS